MTALAAPPKPSGAQAFRDAFLRGIKPDPLLTVSEWADANRYLSSRSSAEPGRWRTDRTPYLREPMDCLSVTSPVQELVFAKGSQVGGTELGNNWLGYVIDRAPGPFMVVMPTEKVQKRKSRTTLDALIEDSPALRSKVSRVKSRDPGNTTLMKVFPGGVLVLASAESPSDLRSMSVRYLFEDELDAFPEELDGEGDPAELAERGTMTFSRNRKTYKTSTPTIDGQSRIWRAFQETDRRFFHVPCPRCGFFQRITWARIKWEKHGEDELDAVVALEVKNRTRAVWMECGSCGGRIEEHEKETMLPAGRWVAEDPSRGGVVRGYHLSALYSPFGMYSWADSVARFLRAKGNPRKLRVWTNQDLGEPWKDKAERPDWEVLFRRRERYPLGRVPRGAELLTAGVDVQGDRLEYEVVAWGPRRLSWSIEYGVVTGDPEGPEVWLALDRLLERSFPFEVDGERGDRGAPARIAALAIDTGHATQAVYRWARRHGDSARVFAVKGRVGTMVPLGPPSLVDVDVGGRKIQRGCRLYPVDTGLLKEELFARLRVAPPLDELTAFADGFCHFPAYGPEYFKGLTSESLVRRRLKSGRIVHDWEKDDDARNEPLDCRVYATAVTSALGIETWEEADWRAVRGLRLGEAPPPEPPTPSETREQKRERGDRWRRAGRRRT